MTRSMHILVRKRTRQLARKVAALKAPAHVMLCLLMVLAMLGFTTNLCCCLVSMPAAASEQVVAQNASDTQSQSPAMLMAAGGHGCCVKTGDEEPSSDQPSPSSNNAPASHDASNCSCPSRTLDAPSHPTTIHHSVAVSELGVFDLPRLTASWQLPVVVDFSVAVIDASPPTTLSDTLVSLACQLTV